MQQKTNNNLNKTSNIFNLQDGQNLVTDDIQSNTLKINTGIYGSVIPVLSDNTTDLGSVLKRLKSIFTMILDTNDLKIGGKIQSSLIPYQNNVKDLGEFLIQWKKAYIKEIETGIISQYQKIAIDTPLLEITNHDMEIGTVNNRVNILYTNELWTQYLNETILPGYSNVSLGNVLNKFSSLYVDKIYCSEINDNDGLLNINKIISDEIVVSTLTLTGQLNVPNSCTMNNVKMIQMDTPIITCSTSNSILVNKDLNMAQNNVSCNSLLCNSINLPSTISINTVNAINSVFTNATITNLQCTNITISQVDFNNLTTYFLDVYTRCNLGQIDSATWNADIIPITTETKNVGSSDKKWNNIWCKKINNSDAINYTQLSLNNTLLNSDVNSGANIDILKLQSNATAVSRYFNSVSGVNSYTIIPYSDITVGANEIISDKILSLDYTKIGPNTLSLPRYFRSQNNVNAWSNVMFSEVQIDIKKNYISDCFENGSIINSDVKSNAAIDISKISIPLQSISVGMINSGTTTVYRKYISSISTDAPSWTQIQLSQINIDQKRDATTIISDSTILNAQISQSALISVSKLERSADVKKYIGSYSNNSPAYYSISYDDISIVDNSILLSKITKNSVDLPMYIYSRNNSSPIYRRPLFSDLDSVPATYASKQSTHTYDVTMNGTNITDATISETKLNLTDNTLPISKLIKYTGGSLSFLMSGSSWTSPVWNNIFYSSWITINGNFTPDSGRQNGTSSYPWHNTYTNYLICNSGITVPNFSISTSKLIPSTTNNKILKTVTANSAATWEDESSINLLAIASNIIPSNSTFALGDITKHWNAYLENVYFYGLLNFLSNSIVPVAIAKTASTTVRFLTSTSTLDSHWRDLNSSDMIINSNLNFGTSYGIYTSFLAKTTNLGGSESVMCWCSLLPTTASGSIGSLGSVSYPWNGIYASNITLTGTVDIPYQSLNSSRINFSNFNQNIVMAGSGYEIASSSVRLNKIWLANIDVSSSLTIPNSSINFIKIDASAISQSIIPNTTNNVNIGSTSKLFNNVYANILNGTTMNVNNGVGQAIGLSSSYYYIYSSVNCLTVIKPSYIDGSTITNYEQKINTNTDVDKIISACAHTNNISGYGNQVFCDKVISLSSNALGEQIFGIQKTISTYIPFIIIHNDTTNSLSQVGIFTTQNDPYFNTYSARTFILRDNLSGAGAVSSNWAVFSNRSIKRNVKLCSDNNRLSKINDINIYTYNRIICDDGKESDQEIGCMADEINGIISACPNNTSDISLYEFCVFLLGCVKELNQKLNNNGTEKSVIKDYAIIENEKEPVKPTIKALKTEIKFLKHDITKLTEKYEDLQTKYDDLLNIVIMLKKKIDDNDSAEIVSNDSDRQIITPKDLTKSKN